MSLAIGTLIWGTGPGSEGYSGVDLIIALKQKQSKGSLPSIPSTRIH